MSSPMLCGPMLLHGRLFFGGGGGPGGSGGGGGTGLGLGGSTKHSSAPSQDTVTVNGSST